MDLNSKLNINTLPIVNALTPILGFFVATIVAHIILNILSQGRSGLTTTGQFSHRTGHYYDDPAIKANNLGTRQLQWAILAMGVCILTMFVLRNITW